MASVLQGDVFSIIAAICSRAHRLHGLQYHSLDAEQSLIGIQQPESAWGLTAKLKTAHPAIMMARPSSAQKGTYFRCTVQLQGHTQSVSDSALIYIYTQIFLLISRNY